METLNMEKFTPHTISEADVIKRILSGEKELYEILLRRNNQKLYRVIRGYLIDQAEIEDIMQNTYLKAYEKLTQFKQSSSFSTWLIRIGIHEALARLKQKGKIQPLHGNSYQKENSIQTEMPDTHYLNPEKRIIRKEAKQLLESAIDLLETKYRTVYILREVEEMSIKDISDCLAISPSNVKVRIHRAKAKLKETLYQLSLDKDIFEFGSSKCDKLTQHIMLTIL